jgi:hypothetical protein
VNDTEQLAEDIERTRADLTRDVDALTDKVSPSRVVERRVEATKAKTRSGFYRLRESVMGSAQSATSTVSGGASSVSSGVSGAKTAVADTASSTAQAARQHAQGNPLAAGLLAFGVGWLVSSLIPASEKETQAAERLEEAAKEHGQPIAQKAAEVGKDVGESLKEKATESVQQVKASAQESAQTVAEEGRSSAETVKEQASSGSSGYSGTGMGSTSDT